MQSSHRGREGELLNTFIVFLLSFDCWCFVSLPGGAVGWSLARVCAMVVAFPSHTHLLFTAHTCADPKSFSEGSNFSF